LPNAAYDAFRRDNGSRTKALEKFYEIINISFSKLVDKVGNSGIYNDSILLKNDNNCDIILNNNPYHDLSKADKYRQSGAILDASYSIIPVFTDKVLMQIYGVPMIGLGLISMGSSLPSFSNPLTVGLGVAGTYTGWNSFAAGVNAFLSGPDYLLVLPCNLPPFLGSFFKYGPKIIT
jgi:hypothetical protein